MNRKSLALSALLTVAGFAVQAESPDASGQFSAITARAAVGDMNQRTRAEVQADYVRSRDAVRAMTAEDSGSSVSGRPAPTAAPQVAGQPLNAQ